MRQFNGRSDPATAHKAITASDSTVLVGIRALYVLTAGNLVLTDDQAVDITYPVVAGQTLPFGPTKVKAASTATCVGWK